MKRVKMNSGNRDSFIEICTVLAEQENLKVTIKESSKGAAMAGAGVLIGGLLGGPPGMAIGGTLSSLGAAWYARGSFKPVAQIIKEMTPAQKKRLSNAVNKAVQGIKPEDFVGVLTLALTSSSVKDLILAELVAFLRKEMNLQILR